MVGLVQGFPLANQPVVDTNTGLLERPWLLFFQGLWNNASQTSLPDGVTLPPGSVDLTAFAPFLNPVGLAPDGLPDPAGYTGPKIVFSSDGNLYRYVNGAWTLDVPAAAIVGQIPIGQIPQIPTSQLTGYIQAAQIQANSIGADQISAGYIYAGNIAASQIIAGTLGAGVILTSSLSAGQITTGTLTGITITGNTINGGTISGATIQSAGSGSDRITITPGGFLQGFNTSNVQTLQANVDLGGGGSLGFNNNAGTGSFGAFIGFGLNAPIVGNAGPGLAFTAGGNFTGKSSSQDAIACPTGGITVTNGYIDCNSASAIKNADSISLSSGTYLTQNGYNLIGNASAAGMIIGNSTFTVAYIEASTGFAPSPTNSVLCGVPANVWSGGNTQVAFTVTSDGDLKDIRGEEVLGLKFINSLRPVMGEWKDNPDGTHHWLIAQEVEKALGGVPFAGLRRPSGEGEYYGLIYEELIPPMIKAIQELSAEVSALKQAA